MDKKYFAASWSEGLKVMTVLVSALLLGMAGYTAQKGFEWASLTVRVPFLILGAVLFAVYALCYAFAPQGYEIDGAFLTIKRPLREIKLPLSGITEAAPIERAALRWSVRLWGVSGLFGFYGLHWKPGLGVYLLYATRCDNLVLLRADKTYVLSPDDAAGFLETVNSRRGGV
ncbi:MAG: PH domain-containing protein [Elusimicrobiales bacterium]